jgi:hypothetical protein
MNRAACLLSLIVMLSLTSLASISRPASGALSGQFNLSAESSIYTLTLFTLQSNSLYGVTCELWITGPDDTQHVWWRVRVDTPGVSPGYAASAQEVFKWVNFKPVWISVAVNTGSSGGTALLQVDNNDPLSQTFNYWCENQRLGSRTPTVVASGGPTCTTVPANSNLVDLYISPSLSASTIYRAQFGVTVDPTGTGQEIHTGIFAVLSGGPAPWTSAITRENVYWERDPSTGRLPVDLSLFGLTDPFARQVALWGINFDSVSHQFCWDATIVSSGTATRTFDYDSGISSITVNPNTEVQLASWSMSSTCCVYVVWAEVTVNSGDATQYINWRIPTVGSDGSIQESVAHSEYQWYRGPFGWMQHFDTHVWKNDGSPLTQYARAYIGNWDSTSQPFRWQLVVYHFAP